MTDRDEQPGLRLLLHVLFLFSGTATILIGPLLPILAAKFLLSDLQLSFYFPAQFSGSLVGTWLSGKLGNRGRYVAASALGAAFIAAGLLILNSGQFALTLAGFAAIGAGTGLTLPSINMTIIEMSPLRAAAALSVLNFCWGIGAIVCKPFVDATYQTGGILLATSVPAAMMAALGILLFLLSKRIVPTKLNRSDTDVGSVRIWATPIAWAFALFTFVHVGFESSMGGWLVTYTERVEVSSGVALWISPTLLYFVFFVAGRGVAPFLFRFLSENRMLLLGLSAVLVGMLVCVSAASTVVLSVGASIAGFGTSWVFPTNLSRFTHVFGPSATHHATPLFICGTLGSAASTWLIGYISDSTGSLRSGMNVLVVSVVILICLQLVLSTRSRSA